MAPVLTASLLVFTAVLGPAYATDTEIQLVNTAPVVLSVSPIGLTSPLFPVTPEAGDTKQIDIQIVVEDLNGCNDITKVDVTVKDPDGGTVNTAELTERDSCTVLTTATYTYTHTIQFHHAPGDYDIEVVATDSKSATGSNLLDLTSFQVQELVAFSVPGGTLSFGAEVEPGTSTTIQSLNVQNTGNVEIDTQISGTSLDHAETDDTIPAANITWSLASDMTGAQTLSGTPTTATNFDLAAGASSTKGLYLRIDVPPALPAGTYSGTLTVTAIKSE